MKTIKRFTMSDKGVLKDTVDQIVCSQARYSLYIGKGFFFLDVTNYLNVFHSSLLLILFHSL